MHHLFKKILNENLKSSPKFGRSDEGSNKLGEILRERRFLYFTKNGPIEIVFNIKHYLSAFILSLVFLFKIVQFLLIGATTFFNYLTFTNNQVINQKFTDSEIETLKNIANDVLNSEKIETKETFPNKDISLESVSPNGKNNTETRIDVREKLDNIKSLVSDFGKSFATDIVKSDEVLLEEFSDLASPEMIAFELNHSFKKKKEFTTKIKKESFSYNDLPVIPFIAPRTKKLKIINFTKKLDLEISQLVNVFKSLNLSPDNINLEEIEDYLKKIDLRADNEELIEDTSLRFQFLEELKNAIIFKKRYRYEVFRSCKIIKN